MLELEYFQVSDVGRVRDHNEDYLGCAPPIAPEKERTQGWLFALADGVGGQDLGEVASRTAVETLLAGFRKSQDGEPHRVLLPRLVQAANAKVFETGLASAPGGVRMSTTLVACALRFDRVVISHVGDSRCYSIRHGIQTRLTRDHVVANTVENETRNLLTRSIGNSMFVSVDTAEHLLQPGDVLLLCSDGLHGSVRGGEMAAIVSRERDLKNAAAELVGLANERDGSDNVSILLVRVRNVERIGMYRGRPYKLA